MQLSDLLARFENVKSAGRDEWSARCPAHDDRVNSLSISCGEEGKLLLHCHAGCDTQSVLSAAGLSFADLYPEEGKTEQGNGSSVREAEYVYYNQDDEPVLKKVRLRVADGSKSFFWQRLENGIWLKGRGGIASPLYGTRSLVENEELLFVAEGEKDCDNVTALTGLPCVSLPDGAKKEGMSWQEGYDACFRGRSVYILQDNDEVGRAFALQEARRIKALARELYVLDLAEIWPEIPEKGDISDMIAALGEEEAAKRLSELCSSAEPWREEPFAGGGRLSCFKMLDRMDEEETQWFIENYIPEGQITTLASDGGVGKTSVAVDIAANRSAGRPCLLDEPSAVYEPQLIAFISTEDSVKKKLKKKLREAGADMRNIIVPDFSDDSTGFLRNFKFGSENMKEFVRTYRPALVIFDPLQGFVPPAVNMGSRNAMRDCMAPLVALGEETGTSFLIICHSNKRKGASGRDRMADSADLWDISRSVLMMGFTAERGVRYLSHEKSNYGLLQETRLFTIDDTGMIRQAGTTWKKDRDFRQESAELTPSGSREDCKDWIMRTLRENNDRMFLSDLSEQAKMEGFSKVTYDRARYELKKDSMIDIRQNGFGVSKKWHVVRLDLPEGWEPPSEILK